MQNIATDSEKLEVGSEECRCVLPCDTSIDRDTAAQCKPKLSILDFRFPISIERYF